MLTQCLFVVGSSEDFFCSVSDLNSPLWPRSRNVAKQVVFTVRVMSLEVENGLLSNTLAFRTDRLVGHRLLDGPKFLLLTVFNCVRLAGFRLAAN